MTPTKPQQNKNNTIATFKRTTNKPPTQTLQNSNKTVSSVNIIVVPKP